MRIVLVGANGQVGREIIAAAGAGVEILALTRAEGDLAEAGAATVAIQRSRPNVVVNAAAWTAVDKAEIEKDAAFRVNADAAGEIAEAARDTGARLIHLSTDYVFSGEVADAPLGEDAPTAPINVYGASKLKGEGLVHAAHPDAVILRTSWVYAAHGTNFVRTMIKVAATRSEVSVVADQIGGPTPASAIAQACLAIAARRDGSAGIFHYQGAPAASWADFADAIFAAANRRVAVNRIPTKSYPTPAQRPLYTVLNCSKIKRDYGIDQPDWRRDIALTVKRLDNPVG